MNKSNPEKISITKPVILLGMMGAGKTSVGRGLAKIMGRPFFDADKEIEKVAGRAIPAIFAEFGEPEFRRIERQVIARLLESETCVLSLGGGAFMNEQTRDAIKQRGFSVWLKVDHALLIKRVLRRDTRPMLKDGDPVEKMNKLLALREPIYALADLTVQCDDRPVAQTAQRVWEAMRDGI